MNPTFFKIIFPEILYIIGGYCNFIAGPNITYEVITVNLNTGAISETEDIKHAVVHAGSASSLNRIVVCGGVQRSGVKSFCQLYSPHSSRYVCLVPFYP